MLNNHCILLSVQRFRVCFFPLELEAKALKLVTINLITSRVSCALCFLEYTFIPPEHACPTNTEKLPSPTPSQISVSHFRISLNLSAISPRLPRAAPRNLAGVGWRCMHRFEDASAIWCRSRDTPLPPSRWRCSLLEGSCGTKQESCRVW